MEHFRYETLEYFGGKGVKSVVWEYLIKNYIQICHYIVAEEPQYWGTWQLIKKKKKKVEMKRKKKENYVANGISSTIEYLLDWTCLS